MISKSICIWENKLIISRSICSWENKLIISRSICSWENKLIIPRSIRVWENNSIVQTLYLPALSAWSVCVLENGDIVVGSSDSTIRIFSKDPARYIYILSQME